MISFAKLPAAATSERSYLELFGLIFHIFGKCTHSGDGTLTFVGLHIQFLLDARYGSALESQPACVSTGENKRMNINNLSCIYHSPEATSFLNSCPYISASLHPQYQPDGSLWLTLSWGGLTTVSCSWVYLSKVQFLIVTGRGVSTVCIRACLTFKAGTACIT